MKLFINLPIVTTAIIDNIIVLILENLYYILFYT